METKFTPGPWERFHKNNIRQLIMAADPRNGCVAECYEHGGGGDEPDNVIANAHLIAAAPELYKSLEDALLCLDLQEGTQPFDSGMKALAKARGEND